MICATLTAFTTDAASPRKPLRPLVHGWRRKVPHCVPPQRRQPGRPRGYPHGGGAWGAAAGQGSPWKGTCVAATRLYPALTLPPRHTHVRQAQQPWEGKETKDWQTQMRQDHGRSETPKTKDPYVCVCAPQPNPRVSPEHPPCTQPQNPFLLIAMGPLVLEEACNQQGALRSEPEQGNHHPETSMHCFCQLQTTGSCFTHCMRLGLQGQAAQDTGNASNTQPRPSVSGPHQSTERLQQPRKVPKNSLTSTD